MNALFDLDSDAAPATIADWRLRARQLLFVLGAGVCLAARVSPGIALGLGVALALWQQNPFQNVSRRGARFLLESSVILLGFSMNLAVILRAGERGLLLAGLTIAGSFLLAALLSRWLGVPRRISTLIAAGTAICGGSAIAAVSSVVEAGEAEIAVSMGAVFLLNAVALYTFPRFGHLLGLSQVQFGAWAGMAIHDISSVVGAASVYGLRALQTATAVKLSRALWIVPVTIVARWLFESERPGDTVTPPSGGEFRGSQGAKPSGEPSLKESPVAHSYGKKQRAPIRIPWFILCFLLASVARSVFPSLADHAALFSKTAEIGMTLTLFLIGAGMNRRMLRSVGLRPLFQAVIVWVVIAGASLAAVWSLRF